MNIKPCLFIISLIASNLTSSAQDSAPTNTARKIKSYRVEEVINMKFGGSKTVYHVSDTRLISTTNLGPDNVRTVFVQYTDGTSEEIAFDPKILAPPASKPVAPRRIIATQKPAPARPQRTAIVKSTPPPPPIRRPITVPVQEEQVVAAKIVEKKEKEEKPQITEIKKEPIPIATIPEEKKIVEIAPIVVTKEQDQKRLDEIVRDVMSSETSGSSDTQNVEAATVKETYAYIDIVRTYEKVAERGFKSAILFKKLADNYYFKEDMVLAAKYYAELFAMDVPIEDELYYRYSDALKRLGQTEKAKEILSQKANKK